MACTNSFKNIAAAGTTQVVTGSGSLVAIIVNTTVASTITIQDGTATAQTAIGVMQVSVAPGTYYYNCRFNAGLRIITAGNSDITVITAA